MILLGNKGCLSPLFEVRGSCIAEMFLEKLGIFYDLNVCNWKKPAKDEPLQVFF